jgi:hypothetical protein
MHFYELQDGVFYKYWIFPNHTRSVATTWHYNIARVTNKGGHPPILYFLPQEFLLFPRCGGRGETPYFNDAERAGGLGSHGASSKSKSAYDERPKPQRIYEGFRSNVVFHPLIYNDKETEYESSDLHYFPIDVR